MDGWVRCSKWWHWSLALTLSNLASLPRAGDTLFWFSQRHWALAQGSGASAGRGYWLLICTKVSYVLLGSFGWY
jgi:hypothetical protein